MDRRVQYVQTVKIQTHLTFKLAVCKQKGGLQPLERYIERDRYIYRYKGDIRE